MFIFVRANIKALLLTLYLTSNFKKATSQIISGRLRQALFILTEWLSP